MIQWPNPELAFCERHLAPFRAEWPKGYMPLLVRMLAVITGDDRFYADMPKDRNGLAETDAISGRLVKFSPLCCFVGDEKMAMLTNEALKFGEAKS